jgi:hypothetical protein
MHCNSSRHSERFSLGCAKIDATAGGVGATGTATGPLAAGANVATVVTEREEVRAHTHMIMSNKLIARAVEQHIAQTIYNIKENMYL